MTPLSALWAFPFLFTMVSAENILWSVLNGGSHSATQAILMR